MEASTVLETNSASASTGAVEQRELVPNEAISAETTATTATPRRGRAGKQHQHEASQSHQAAQPKGRKSNGQFRRANGGGTKQGQPKSKGAANDERSNLIQVAASFSTYNS